MYHLIISSILLFKSKEGKERTTNIKYNRLPTRFLLALHFLAVVVFLLSICIFASSFSQSRLTPKLPPCLPSLPPSLHIYLIPPGCCVCIKTACRNTISICLSPDSIPANCSGVILIFLDQVGREGGREGGPTSTSSLPAAASDSKPPAATPSASASVRGPSLPVAPV